MKHTEKTATRSEQRQRLITDSLNSSVPEDGFRPIETLDDLQERFFDACCILSNVCSYLSQHRDGSWELARQAQDAAIDLHTTLVDTRYTIGTPRGDA